MSSKSYPNHWLEKIIREIDKRNPKIITLATGKTPSGHIHMGILRELLICDAIQRKYQAKGKQVKYRLFLDSLDAAKRFPGYISEDFARKHLGKPFALIPNPFNTKEPNYAEFFGNELIENFETLGINVEIVWSHNLYKTKEMQDKIRIGLEKNEKVKEIVAKYLTASMTDEQKEKYLKQQEGWMGAMVICEKCQRTQKKLKDGTISPNRALSFNKEKDTVTYKCPACGYEGEVKISSGLVKLNWRLDWPAKWAIFNTTCEPAGKDHCTPGGSYDTGLELCREIYGYEGPVKVSYEWLRLGDKDMKTSKGIVFTPKKFLEIAAPEIIRMLILQTNPNKHISIRVEEMEQYYNEYERMEKIYFNIEKPINEQEKEEIDYIYPLIQIQDLPKKCPEHLPFKFLTILAQLESVLGEDGIHKKAEEYSKTNNWKTIITKEELRPLIERAKNWINEMKAMIKTEKNPQIIKKLKQKAVIFEIPKEIPEEIIKQLTDIQKSSLKRFVEMINNKEELTEEKIKQYMMDIRQELGIRPKKLFEAFYLIFLAEKKGPRLGPLLAMLEKDWVIERIKKAIE